MDSSDPLHQLGKELFVCRNHTPVEISRRMGLNYWYLAVFNAVVFSFLAGALIGKLAEIPPPQMFHPAFYLTTAATAVLIIAGSTLIGRTPSKKHLAAHEAGFCFGRQGIRYDEISSIHLGTEQGHWLSKMTRFTEAMAQLPIRQSQMRSSAALLRTSRDNSMTVMLKGGKSVFFKSLCLLVVDEDMDRFFEIFDKKCPGMLEEAADDDGGGEGDEFSDAEFASEDATGLDSGRPGQFRRE
jgi:hypothetical protein